jgi:hypothetical protein
MKKKKLKKATGKIKIKTISKVRKKTAKIPKIPKTYLTINKKQYRAIDPQKALAIGKKLNKGVGKYKVHVVYGTQQISLRKKETVENIGEYKSAKEARVAILAFLNRDLWISN